MTGARQPARTTRAPAAARVRFALPAAATLAAIVAGWAWVRIASTPGIDYYAAWAASRAVADGIVDDPWSARGREKMGRRAAARAFSPDAAPRELGAAAPVLLANRGELPTAGTPFFFAVLGTLSVGDYEADYVFFSFTSLVLYVTSILWLCRQLDYGITPSLLALSFLAGPFSPWLSGESVANVQAIQLALVAALPAAMSARKARLGELAAGALFAAGVAFKPNLLPVALPTLLALLVRRRWRTLAAIAAGALGGAGLSLGASVLFFGRASCWLDWARIVPELVRPPYDVDIGNFSLPTVLREITGIDAGVPLLVLALGGLAAFEAATAASRSRGARGPGLARVELVALVGLGGALLLLTARLAWLHYFVLAVPLLLFVLRPVRDPAAPAAPRPERIARAAAAIAFVQVPTFGLPLRPLAQGVALGAALVVLVVLALRILSRSPGGGAPVPA